MESLTKDIIAEDFQLAVESSINRNKNLLDTTSKKDIFSARLTRAIVKAITSCGCISVHSEKCAGDTCLEGKLCKNCRDVVESEMGEELYYLAAICNALDLSIYDIMLKEKSSLSMLGKFSLK